MEEHIEASELGTAAFLAAGPVLLSWTRWSCRPWCRAGFPAHFPQQCRTWYKLLSTSGALCCQTTVLPWPTGENWKPTLGWAYRIGLFWHPGHTIPKSGRELNWTRKLWLYPHRNFPSQWFLLPLWFLRSCSQKLPHSVLFLLAAHFVSHHSTFKCGSPEGSPLSFPVLFRHIHALLQACGTGCRAGCSINTAASAISKGSKAQTLAQLL